MRGEVAGQGKPSSPEGLVTTADIGLTHKDIHEARTIRDAEVADPGIVRRALDEKLAAVICLHHANHLDRGPFALTAPTAPCKRLPAWGAEADARFLWPQRRWHCRHWPGRALAL